MGLSVLNQPVAASGGIKSVQRGSAVGAGNVTITAVDISKSFVTVFGTTSSGTVAASGAVGSYNISAPGISFTGNQSTLRTAQFGTSSSWGQTAGTQYDFGTFTVNGNLASSTLNAASSNISGGSNNLVAAVVQGYLSNSTTLVVSGACRWEVVEFN